MSKSSTVTVREKPVEDKASATAGGLTIHGETIVISTDQRIELIDLTKQIIQKITHLKLQHYTEWLLLSQIESKINQIRQNKPLMNQYLQIMQEKVDEYCNMSLEKIMMNLEELLSHVIDWIRSNKRQIAQLQDDEQVRKFVSDSIQFD